MSDEQQQIMVRLYFPNIASGEASVGYCTVTIKDHCAEVDASQAAAIQHWIGTDNAIATYGAASIEGESVALDAEGE